MPFGADDSYPLEGIRILDLSRYLPGPLCSRILGDLGADIVKVEEPGVGDPARWVAPRNNRETTLHLALNRNKRSIELNLRREEGKEILVKLARRSDVLIETFRPGVMERLDLGHERLLHENGRLVYCSISGYGRDGPYRDRAGHDLCYQALAGLLEHRDSAAPAFQTADVVGGALPAAIAILVALLERQRTGKGRLVDVSIYEGLLSCMAYQESRVGAGERDPLDGSLPCYRTYETRSGGKVALGALEPKFFERFCDAAQRPDLKPRAYDRSQETRKEFERLFQSKSREEWLALSRSKDICLEPVLSMEEALASRLAKERGFIQSVRHPTEGTLFQPGSIARFGTRSLPVRRHPPGIGEQTEEILSDLGYSKKNQARLAKEGVTREGRRLRRFCQNLRRSIGWCVGDNLLVSLLRRR